MASIFTKGFDFLITVTAPGKLYIAGEYAVVEAGHPAILAAINHFVKASITPAEQTGAIISRQYPDFVLHFRHEGTTLVCDQDDHPFGFVVAALKLTEQFAHSRGKQLTPFKLVIDSNLDSQDGKKYGLGSSAAVTVATVKAVAQFYALNLTKSETFKLAALAHFSVQGNGSLGDIAASVYGGFIAYHSVDRTWLMTAFNRHSLADLIAMPWAALKITPLTLPANLQLMVGWTGAPASTAQLVSAVGTSTAAHPAAYLQFLAETAQCVSAIAHGFATNDTAAILAGITHNRQLLRQLGQLADVAIETPLLTQLCESAEQLGGAAKSSGAGGGDCGIALIERTAAATVALKAKWQAAGIVPLSLQIYQND